MAETDHARQTRAILYAALAAPMGIQVFIESPDSDEPGLAMRAKQILYRFKNEDSDFEALQIRFCPTDPDRRLWIIKNGEPNQC